MEHRRDLKAQAASITVNSDINLEPFLSVTKQLGITDAVKQRVRRLARAVVVFVSSHALRLAWALLERKQFPRFF